MAWYGIRSLIKHGADLFEERIVLLDAEDDAAAFRAAEAEVDEYCVDLTDTRPMGFQQAFRLVTDDVVIDARSGGLEVFSLIRRSDLPDGEYIDRFFDTGDEFEQKQDPEGSGSA